MFARALTIMVFVALAGCATAPPAPPQDKALQAPKEEKVEMSGGFSPVLQIPVTDSATKSVMGALFEPEGTGPFPAVILLSGCGGWETAFDVGVVRRVNADYLPKRIAVLVLDSLRPRGVKNICANDQAMMQAIDYRAEDAYAAMRWLAERSEIDKNHIFLQGYSHGAMSAIEAIGPKADSHKQKFAGVIAFFPYCFGPEKFSVPTIILVGEKDDWTPANRCQILRSKNLEVVIYPDATHYFVAPGLNATYLGHHLVYQEEATSDAQRRALALIESLSK